MVYVKWSIIDRWKREEKAFRQYQRGEVGEGAPYAYGSAQCCLYTLSEPGTVIWVVSSPRFSGRLLPPTIIARLCVRNRINRKDSSYDATEIPSYFSKKWHYVVLAGRPPESFYLPLNNASKEITTELIFKGQKKAFS